MSESDAWGSATADSTAKLDRALSEAVLRMAEVSASAGDRFRAALDSAAPYGGLIAAQHLRNLCLAHGSARSLAGQSSIGLTTADMPITLELAERLDRAIHSILAARRGMVMARPSAERVLIVLDHLPVGGRIFSHGRQIGAYASAIARSSGDVEIGILVTQETAPENPFGAREVHDDGQAAWLADLLEIDRDATRKVVVFSPPRLGPARPYAMSLDWARAYGASVVLAPQGVFRSRLLPSLLAPNAALVALQMNASNPEPEFADLVLAHGDGTDRTGRRTPGKWRDHPVPMLPFAPLPGAPSGGDARQPPLVVATVLTQGRLERGLLKDRGGDLDLVLSFLRDHPQAEWRMIGLDDPPRFADRLAELTAEADPLADGRLRLVGVIPDPTTQFVEGGLYVHLPALGGGAMGAAMAIAAGMAVLARAGGDIANLLPTGHVYRDRAQARLWLRRLADDADLRKRWRLAQQRTLSRDHSIAAAAAALAPVIAEARTIAAEKNSRATMT